MVTPVKMNQIYKYTAAAATVGAPALYMIHFHDILYTDPTDRKRMLNKQLGFWSGMGAGVFAVHQTFRKHRKNTPLMITSLVFMACSSYLGVKIAKVINKAVFPRNNLKPQPQMQPLASNTLATSPAFEAFLKSYKA